MSSVFFAHFIPLIIIAGIAVGIAGWALIRDPVDGLYEFVALAGAVVIWTVTSGWMMFLTSEIGLNFGYYIQLFFEWVIPAIFLLFIINYSNNEQWLDSIFVKAYIYALPFVFLMGSFTDPLHNLILTEIIISTEPFGTATGSPGELFYLARLYSYTTLVIGLIVIARFSVRSNQISKWQVGAVAATIVIIGLTSLFQFSDFVPVTGFNYILLAFGLFYVSVGYLFLRDPALDIGSLARQKMVESVESGIVILTTDYQVADYNSTAAEAYPQLKENIGQDIRGVLPELFDNVKEVEPKESVRTTIGDNEVEFSVTLSPIEQDGEIEGYGIILNDVTELREYSRQLEQKSEQLDQFASMVSHDLRSPINVAKTNAGFASAVADNDEVNEYAEEVNESLNRAEELIEDLLTLAREGRTIQDRQYVPVRELVENARETSPLSEEQATIKIGDEMEVYADPERFRTVVENLMRNATDHVGEDVRIEVGELSESTGIYIEDDGPGVPDDKKDKIFEHGHTTHDDGTGLGLSIVSSIVDAHGWKIRVIDGESLGGARFEIETGERND